jgi:hypothetical protein
MCGVCMNTSVHQLKDWCVESVWKHLYTIFSDLCLESVWTHLYTSCHTDVWSLYGDICPQDIRLMCGVCKYTFVHQLSDWCVESVWITLYTSYQTDVCNLYVDICSRVAEWCVESVWRHLYTNFQTDVWSVYRDICTPVVGLMCGVCMDSSVHKLSDWSVESV